MDTASVASQTQRIALITGCSEPQSIGAALAHQLHAKGWRVFATARKVESMTALEEEGCDVLELDVTSDESVKAAVAQLQKATGGRLDLLVNNAGVASLAPLLDMDVEQMRALYDVNVFGGVRMVQACAEMLVRTAHRGSANGSGKGTILNIGSIARYMPPWQSAYGSSKAALGAISDTMRLELAPLGVKVIGVNLGSIQTAMLSGTKTFPIQRAVEDRSPFYTYFDNVIKPKFAATNSSAWTAAQIAQLLIRAVEKKSPPRTIWAGASTGLFRYLLSWLPTSWADALWNKVAGVDGVRVEDATPKKRV